MARSQRAESRMRSSSIAFCGVMAGLSVTLMLASSFIPIATYCAPIYGGVLLLPILIEYGKKSAWKTFAATALISLLLCGDKEAAFFYLFIGYYPIVKSRFDKTRPRSLRIAFKLLFFNLSLGIMYALLTLLLGFNALWGDFIGVGVALFALFVVIMNVCLMLYDKMLTPMSLLYVYKLRPKFRFLRR